MKYRWEIINWLIEKRGYKSYLEIGVKYGDCFNRVECDTKIGVDIKPLIVGKNILKMSSNEFFAHSVGQLDIIFIDGDHHEEQVDHDIQNSLKRLAPGGTIVMHDCDPKKKVDTNPAWNGTVYKSFLKLRHTNLGLKMFVVDVDWGCGVIWRGSQKPLDIPENPTWEEFDRNRVEWLDLITVDEFTRRINES